jgi:hypothetical protein
MFSKFLMVLLFLGTAIPLVGQDDDSLLDLLGEDEPTVEYAKAGFKTTRIINGHSFEMNSHGVMDMKISHRFGAMNGGAYELFGLDQASVRIGLDYGVNDWLNIGFGRTNIGKFIDGFAKLKLLRQQTGKKNMPISLLYVSDMSITTIRKHFLIDTAVFTDYPITDRLYFTHQIIIGRKFNEGFSLQFMPTMVHRNFTSSKKALNDVFVMGIGGRVKLNKRVALNAEYYYVLPNQLDPAGGYKNSLSIGFDIETGGHVFQLHFTNSTGMVENAFLTQTTDDWLKGGIHFGFNVSRVFSVYRPKR